MARKRYLFFDIDGTLLAGGYENSYVPASAREALVRLREAGHFLAIATGRAQAMAVGIMEELGLENMVSDGGYGLTIHGKLLDIRPLPKDLIVALVHECEEKGFPWGLQVDNSFTRVVPDGRFLAFTRDRYLQTRVVPGLTPESQETIYKMYIACLAPREQELTLLSTVPWCRFHREYLFVEPADKAAGIRQVLDHFHADHSDAIVFGDSKNDLSMFTDEWTKVAMGNAIPELKERADLVTSDILDDGIYQACEALGLFEPVTETLGLIRITLLTVPPLTTPKRPL